MNDDLEALASGLERTGGVFPGDLERLVSSLHAQLPADYLEFMRVSNGAEGPVGEDAYVVLWPVEEIFELNETYRVDDFAPGLVLFGTDGGNTGFAFDRRAEDPQIVSVPLVGMSLGEVELRGSTLTALLRGLSASRST